MRHGIFWQRLLSTGILLMGPLIAAGEARADTPLVAVFDIEDRGGGLSPKMLLDLRRHLSLKLTDTGAYRVVPHEQLDRLLGRRRQPSSRRCHDQACQITTGQQLAAQKALGARILKIGSGCVVVATMLDLLRSRPELSASHKTSCWHKDLVSAVDHVVTRLQAQASLKVLAVRATGRGRLVVLSRPAGAEVWVDGTRRSGVTPAVLPGLRVGEHLVELRKEGYRYLGAVWIQAGQTSKISAILKPARGNLEVLSAPPGATIFLDGRQVGRTPKMFMEVAAGLHVIELRKPGYLDARGTVKLGAEAGPRTISVPLQYASVIAVRTTPPGATLYLDGRVLGRTPMEVRAALGTHLVKLVLRGHAPVARQVIARAGEVSVLTMGLGRGPGDRRVARRQAPASGERPVEDGPLTQERRVKQNPLGGEPQDVDDPVSRQRKKKAVLAYTSLAVGLAVAATAGMLYGVGASEGSEAHDAYMDARVQRDMNLYREDIEGARSKIIAGNVLMGVAAVALGFSIYQFVTRPEAPRGPKEVDLTSSVSLMPAATGATFSIGGRF